MITRGGIEGSAVYALSALLRSAIEKNGSAMLMLDLRPGLSEATLLKELQRPRAAKSLSTHLRQAGFTPLAIGLLQEISRAENRAINMPHQQMELAKKLPLKLNAPFSLERAISSAGGIAFSEIDGSFMLRKKPGVFTAGEMLDWEAPTGGYLLQACFSTGIAAAKGIQGWLARQV
jgi:predicted flavoprotein YhiN